MVGILGGEFVPLSQMAVLLVVAALIAPLVAARDGPALGWWGRALLVAVCSVTTVVLGLVTYVGVPRSGRALWPARGVEPAGSAPVLLLTSAKRSARLRR
jgi:hypothetical protein